MKKIANKEEYEETLKRLEIVFQADPCTPEGDEAEILANMVVAYEDIHYPIDLPDENGPEDEKE